MTEGKPVVAGTGGVTAFDRHCAEVVTQTILLTEYLDGADLGLPVPTCPGWNVSQLLRHVDGGLRWATKIVGTRATAPPPDGALRDLSGFTDEDPSRLTESLTEAAALLQRTLVDAGADAQMWCPVDGGGAGFFARRFTHETVIHRADTAFALGAEYQLETGVAVDAVDEWLELGCMPFHFEVHPWMRELLGPGRTIGLHATDIDVDWLLDFTGDVIVWRRSGDAATADLRGSVTDLLMTIYRRLPLNSGAVEVAGDTELVDFWLERVGFG